MNHEILATIIAELETMERTFSDVTQDVPASIVRKMLRSHRLMATAMKALLSELDALRAKVS